MKRTGGIFDLLVAVSLLVATSCSTTTLTATWKDPDYRGGKLDNVLIIGVAKDEVIRRMYEDEFTSRLKARGTGASPSYSIIPSSEMLDKETVEAKIQNLGMDAVLVTRLVNTKKEKVYTPGTTYYTGGGWYGPYSRGYGYARSPGYYTEYEVFSLETKIYDTQTGKMIWSGLSDTVAGGSTASEIKEVIDTIIKSLSANGFIS